MEITGFDWDTGNQAKCTTHGVTTGDIESLFAKPILVIDDPHDASRERRFRAIGKSSKDRFIFVVFTIRNGMIRPISARFMHQKEIRRYEKDNPNLHQR
jgi:uncharacterized DUF497 family protein